MGTDHNGEHMENKLRNFFESHYQSYLDIYKKLVSTNSFTSNTDGVNENGNLIAQAFSGLGFVPERIQSSNPEFGAHLVLTRKGTSDTRIGLITHLDTVFSPEEEEANNFSWRIEGDRVYGPGTNDIKGGTVIVLMVLDALNDLANDLFEEITWIVLANAAEERWSYDFGELCRDRLGEDGLAALIFEAGYVDDNAISLVRSRKGMAVYDINIEGKSAHAGNNHQFGANAIVQLAQVIQKVESLTDYEKDLTYNIGVASGGSVPNRVPQSASARGEMRTFSKDVFNQGVKNLLAINEIKPVESAVDGYPCKLNIEVILENDPWPRNEGTDNLIRIWRETGKSLGVDVILEDRGGLSDGNQLWEFVPTIDGLGPNGRNAHCSEHSPDGSKEQEYATLSSLIPKAVLNTLALKRLVTGS